MKNFDYNQLISKSIGGNIDSDDIAPYENFLYGQTVQRVEHDYLEEIKDGDLAGQKLQAVIYLNHLKSLEIDTQLKSIVRLTLLYHAQSVGLFYTMGFDDIESWLDSFGINARTGHLSQLLAIAREIVPWTIANKLKVNGRAINLNWFKRIVNGKCLAARACLLVSLFRRTVKSGPLESQKQIITQALVALENPGHSRSYLQDTFNGYSSQFQIKAEKFILPDGRKAILLVADDPSQEQWIHRKLGSTTHFQKVYTAIVYDQGLAWLSPQAMEHLKNIQI